MENIELLNNALNALNQLRKNLEKEQKEKYSAQLILDEVLHAIDIVKSLRIHKNEIKGQQ